MAHINYAQEHTQSTIDKSTKQAAAINSGNQKCNSKIFVLRDEASSFSDAERGRER